MTRTAPANVPPPSAGQVSMLQAVRGYPCVSVLMTTTPASRMTQPDVDRLRSLTREAARRMDEERLAGPEPTVLQALQRLAGDAAAEPTGAAVALYASRAMAISLRLPVPVRDRVVVDPTFATRDLVRALHRTPRHVVLTLTGTEARLFDGAAGDLRPALRSAFPRHNTLPRPRDGHHAGRREAGAAHFFRDVDRALGGYLRLHPAPLILVGPERALATFRQVSRNLQRLAGSVTGSHTSTPLPELARLISPILDAYLHSRHQDALALLDRRAGADRLVSGMPGAWLAARRERPEMLAVEDSLFYPARLTSDGDLLLPAEDVEHPDVLDDAVDELIELVLDRGGWVALLPDGALQAFDGVALALRARD